jgi:hypothetical protein
MRELMRVSLDALVRTRDDRSLPAAPTGDSIRLLSILVSIDCRLFV